MDQNLPRLYRDYGQYSNWRNFPSSVDGLKPVERRVLLSAYKIAKSKLVKSRKVDSYTTGNYHPHGACITGETKILLLDGTKVKIKDLVGREMFWVYSCTKDGDIKPGLAHSARVTKKVSLLYRIYLDNESYFDCTEDHLIMLRNGNYKTAKDIVISDSLMPLRTRTEDGYTQYRNNNINSPRSEKVACMVVRELIEKNLDALIGRKKYHVHHKNSVRNDDRPENLEFLYYKDHASITAKNMPDSSKNKIRIAHRKRFYENEEYREKILKGLEKGRETMFSEDSPIRERIRKKNSKLMNNYNKIYVKDRILKTLHKMITDNVDINEENYEIYRKQIYNGPLWKTILKKFGSVEEAISIAKDYNHKVTKIEILELENEIEVFDLSVERYHNFAIESGIFVHNCYGSIVQLVRQGFLIGQGNFGSNSGVDPVGAAADRYTECQLHPKTVDLAFKYLDHVPWVNTDLDDKEPVYLPTMFPLCLMGNEYTQGIGFGFKSYIPCYTIKDLHQRLLWLLGIRKRQPIIAPITDCNIISDKKDLTSLLTKGKARIEVEGVIEINQRLNTLTLRSWPPGKKFQTLLNKFSQELNDGMIGWRDETGESSEGKTEIVFEVIRERNRDKIFRQFVEKMKETVKGSISFELVVVDENRKVTSKGVDELLLNTYNMFSKTNERMLQFDAKKIDDMILEYKTLIKIRPTLADGIAKKMKPNKIIELIKNQTGVSEEISRGLINKYRISKLLTIDIDIPELNIKKGEVLNLLSNLDKFVLEQYNNF